MLNDYLDEKQIEQLNIEQFKTDTITTIDQCLKFGISFDRILMHFKPNFPVWKNNLIKTGLINNLTDEQIKFYVDEKFNDFELLYAIGYDYDPIYINSQAEQIMNSFIDKIPEDIIFLYAKPEIELDDMEKIRLLVFKAIQADINIYDFVESNNNEKTLNVEKLKIVTDEIVFDNTDIKKMNQDDMFRSLF